MMPVTFPQILIIFLEEVKVLRGNIEYIRSQMLI